jgi:hypothetical protein
VHNNNNKIQGNKPEVAKVIAHCRSHDVQSSDHYVILCGCVVINVIISPLARLTPEPLSFKEAFTYSHLTQNSVMTLQIPESYLRDHSVKYRQKSSTSATGIKAVHNIFFSGEETQITQM